MIDSYLNKNTNMSEEVPISIYNLEELSSKIEEVSKSLDQLNNDFGKLSSDDDIINPNSDIADIDGSLELVGGTFSIDEKLHSLLANDLDNFLETETSDEVVGAGISGSKELKTLKKIKKSGNIIKNDLKNIEDSVTKRINNINSLQNVLNNSFEKLFSIIKTSTDVGSVTVNDAAIIKEVHTQLNNEFSNQLKSLENVLNIKIKPSKDDLLSLLKNNSSFTALAEKLGVSYNDSDASDRLALAYTNMSQLQLISKQVKDSLNTLKISLDKYKDIKNLENLKNSLSGVLKNITESKTTTELSRIIKAMDTLKKHQHHHDEIVKCLVSNKCGSNENGGKNGGDYTSGFGRVKNTSSKSTLKTRIKTYESTVKELFKNFISQINLNFKDIKSSVEFVSEQLGNDIPYDENVKLFISIFEGFNNDIENTKLFYALISLDQTMSGRELKTRFMDNLKRLIESLTVLKSHKYLSEIKKQLELVKETIETYSDTVLNIRSSEESSKIGKGEFLWTDKLVDPSLPASTANIIKNTIIKLKFYGNISMIKDNLNRMTLEHVEYKSEYNNLLGKSIGVKLTELNKEYTENIDRLNDKERGRGWVLDQYNIVASAEDKIPRGLVETIYKLQYEAKTGLYKTIEAIDMYLMNFTEKLSGNIEAVKDLNSMLKQTELISKWFDINSGNKFADLMELIQPDVDQLLSFEIAVATNTSPDMGIASFKTGKVIREVLENSKKSIESVAMLKNIISMFVHIGDKFGDKSLVKDLYMSPNIIYKNLVKYIWVSAFTMGYGTAGGDVKAVIDSVKKDKNGYEIESGNKSSFFDLKMTVVTSPLDTLGKFEKQIKSEIDKLKNILVVNSTRSNLMSGGTVLNSANSFDTVLAGTTTAQLNNIRDNTRIDLLNSINRAVAVANAAGNSMIDASANQINNKQDLFSILGAPGLSANVAISYYSQLSFIEKNLKNDIFVNEDKYFILSLKAISAKILTVIASANLLKQPASVVNMITNPVRTIIGGAALEVINEAAELYVRLPLLVEFYKNIFENGNEGYKKNKFENDETETIAFIPEIGSIWSGLIQCIFDDSKQISSGIYSIENMQRIIAEVNKIYKNYKNVETNKLTRTIVLDLISEINRRYGVLKRQEINEFYQIKKKYTNNIDDVISSSVDYDILDDSNEFEDAGPSRQFTENVFNKQYNSNKIVQNDINIVKDFRDKIHNELFNNNNLRSLSGNSFSERIKFYKNEITQSTSQQSKVELIVKAIDESSNINSHNVDTNLMYHELIQFPLCALQNANRHYMTLLSNYLPIMYSTLVDPIKVLHGNVYNLVNKIDLEGDFAQQRSFLMTPSSIRYNIDLGDFSVTPLLDGEVEIARYALPGAPAAGAVLAANVVANIVPIDGMIVDAVVALNFSTTDSNIVKNMKLRQAIINVLYVNTPLFVKTDIITNIDETLLKIVSVVDVGIRDSDANSFRNSLITNIYSSDIKFNKVTLLNFITEFTLDKKLIEIKFVSTNKFIIDYSKLQTSVENSIESIKYMISKFRNQVSNTIISTSERLVSDIEDKLLFKIVYNQDTSLDNLFEIANFEFMNNSISEVLRLTFDDRISDDIYSSVITREKKIGAILTRFSTLANNNPLLSDAFKTYMNRDRRWVRMDLIPPPVAAVAAAAAPLPIPHDPEMLNIIHGDNIFNDSGSLLMKFNNIVYKYLNVFYESSSKKIYNGLFNEFANKSQSSVIFGNSGMPDMFDNVSPVVNANFKKYVSNDHILSESIGLIIKNLISRTVNKQLPTKYHLQNTISEVSPNMVEKYKAYLPLFITIFETLISNAINYKKILDNTNPDLVNEPRDPALAVDDEDIVVSGVVSYSAVCTDEEGEEFNLGGKWVNGTTNSYVHINNVLTNLIDASRSLINDASNVLKELDKKTQFFEIKENFIKNFYNNSNVLPLMPNSLISATVNDQLKNPVNIIPKVGQDDGIVKYLYGSNFILNDKELDNNINSFVWFKENIKNYNNSVLSVNKIDIEKVNSQIESTNNLFISLYKTNTINKLFLKMNLLDVPFRPDLKIDTYFSESTTPVINVISIVENSTIENNKSRIANSISASSIPNYNRTNARLLNIIDLNIVPINIHALMREIPLINIYNYAFTFDSIVKKELVDFNIDTGVLDSKLKVFTSLMLDPYYSKYSLFGDDVANAGVGLDDDIKIPTTEQYIRTSLKEKVGDIEIGKYISDSILDVANDNSLQLNSKFVRNLTFLANLQRFIIFKIKKEVERIDTKTVSDIAILNKRITSYDDPSDRYDDNEFEYLEV